MNLKTFLTGFGIIAILLTLFPFIPVDHWSIRVFDFPHFQLFLLTLAALVTYLIRYSYRSRWDNIFLVLLISCTVVQFTKIYAYTALAPCEIGHSDPSFDEVLKLYTANVLQDNRSYDLVIDQVLSRKPDVVVFTETDSRWLERLDEALGHLYAHRVTAPHDNTYGMTLYSALPIENARVEYLISDSIPSIHGTLKSKTGKDIQLHVIHPTPPTPTENPLSTDRDAELMKVALRSYESELPVIIMGDFNDVAWSESTRNFQAVSGLLDMRKGRGFFNTYNAETLLMRWPLDHIFVSEHFRVQELDVTDDIDSDHFPFYAVLTLEPDRAEEQKRDEPTEEQLKYAYDQLKNEKQKEQEQEQEKE